MHYIRFLFSKTAFIWIKILKILQFSPYVLHQKTRLIFLMMILGGFFNEVQRLLLTIQPLTNFG